MKSMEQTPSQSRNKARVYITIFFVALAGISIGFTVGIAPMLQGVQQDASSKIPHWSCVGIPAGDVLEIESLTTTRVVRLHGIVCPPREEGPALSAMAEELGFQEEALMHQGDMARNTVAAWIYKRRLDVEWLPEFDEAGTDESRGYVSVFGVDVGRKMLQGGQAMALREDHPRRDAYLAYEEEAREKGRGIWRTP
jgi:endonuclease YncB( thermonuclease family)